MELSAIRLMHQTRMLQDPDIHTILKGTPRPFGKCTHFVVGGERLVLQPPLSRGRGMLMGLQYGDMNHMVAVYRCHDGNYIYHDSQDSPPHPAFLEYCLRNGISKL
ncbi:hypothetical protein E2C01_090252 [Portunus trituberculatus]|uniref:Uncharacterized protein n=1 Tax=Portunus trituberculatus TaxID=210409 RepID=A0A5B7JPL7_PORTR|nr:hypothetical protein [Portunus trituberculatus]